jgi:hypothetical protein
LDGAPIGTTNWFVAVQQALHYLDFQVQIAIGMAKDAGMRAGMAQGTANSALSAANTPPPPQQPPHV